MNTAVDVPDPYHIIADDRSRDPETRVLKHGDSFAVFDLFGDITPTGGRQGLYHGGTRRLSACELRVAGHRPVLLGSSPGAASHVLTIDLTNPDITDDGEIAWPSGTLHVRRTTFLWAATCYMRATLTNHGRQPMPCDVELTAESDFKDVFEVRGTRRASRGRDLPSRAIGEGLVLAYQGLDRVTRQTVVRMEPAPTVTGGRSCRVHIVVPPGGQRDVFFAVDFEGGLEPGSLREAFDRALARAAGWLDLLRRGMAGVRTSSEHFDEWLERSRADVAMMVTDTPNGPYPYAGIPWFSTMFGRDGILTALAMLWADPSLARGVLLSLAATQATSTDPARDAQPGKILHEARLGEMAVLGEIPFGAYYGGVDTTPLFVLLAGRYYDRTGDLATIERLWPHLDAALTWIDQHGDLDRDGFVEYARATDRGLANQGWKDSHDAVFHADGSLAEGPIALCEVQAYVYAARHHAAELAQALGDKPRARGLRDAAERLHATFEEAFWLDDLGVYALALDGEKRPCRVVSSNAAQCLMSGIAVPEHARRIGDVLMRDDMFSGWGVRTIRRGESRYNPMAYHNGSIWPHDTAMAALGLARYGLKDHVVRLCEGMFAAAQAFDLRRLPELFCGFPRVAGEPPTRYPTACAPQAWASASTFLFVQALLGLDVDGRQKRVVLRQPRLPEALDWLRLSGLGLGDAQMDLLCERRGDDVGISVTRRAGGMRLFTEK